MEKKEVEKEKEHLQKVCKILNQKIDEMSNKIFKNQEDIREFQKYVWENKGDMDVQELTSVRTSSEMEAKRLLEERNYFEIGEEVTIFSPDGTSLDFKITEIYDEEENPINVVRHPKQIVKIKVPKPFEKYSLMRIKRY